MLKRILAVLFVLLFAEVSFAQGLHATIEQRKAESAQAKAVKGATEIQIAKSYVDTYEGLLNWLKRSEYMIDSANKETGQISTVIEVVKPVKGGGQDGKRIVLVLMKDSDVLTTVRVMVTYVHRDKILSSTGSWNEPKLNADETKQVAEKVSTALATQKVATND